VIPALAGCVVGARRCVRFLVSLGHGIRERCYGCPSGDRC
jgi:hypothetical protein